MDIVIEKGTEFDIDQLAQLYDDLNDFLAGSINYPGWIKGVYPIRENAVNGVTNDNLYVAKIAGKIVGSIILSHEPEPAYSKARWKIDSDYSSIFVVYTFVVHPDYLKNGIGTSLMDFAAQYCMAEHAKSIRLDVYENNVPAIKLYEKCGFEYIDTVDLGLGNYGLNHFKLYEKLLQ
ncbi:Acetyltransferase (GNAT) family protein [Caprobacter fermentans]|uniref:Acetyltransferase (GNAT) family protein n=1 Tax=Caproicibacter fermentans TaxID=2576756 RepID=A0A6N8I3K5_9FIRM|nr:GNAT family N-acetyltransferase [Caproicibacter fermentans]MVB12731.1 Acetyltransferase (GNAT) family protein [Caproicibacter fermentans]OCN02199.1 acetyltransferase [Clostridium sp. W14A]